MTLTLTSSAFADGAPIPRKFAREGENLSPPLRWTGVPDGVESFALVIEDPDAPSGTFRHWAVFNIPPDRTELPQSVDTGPDHALRYARNDFGGNAYDGPEPPPGHGVHHYHFRLAALDVPKLDLPDAVMVEQVWREAQQHRIAETELVGTYER